MNTFTGEELQSECCRIFRCRSRWGRIGCLDVWTNFSDLGSAARAHDRLWTALFAFRFRFSCKVNVKQSYLINLIFISDSWSKDTLHMISVQAEIRISNISGRWNIEITLNITVWSWWWEEQHPCTRRCPIRLRKPFSSGSSVEG